MLRSLYRNLRFKRRVEGELDSELRAYVDMLIDEKMRAGLDGPTARRDARLEVGGLEQVKEQVREVQAGRRLWDLAQDIRISARALSQNRSFTGFALLMLMLGIGATTTVFSVFYSVVLKPLPFRDLDRIVEIWETRLDRGWAKSSFAEGNFWDARSLNRSFSEMAAIGWSDATLIGLDHPEHVSRGAVSAGFFRVLGLAAVIGRDFTYSEDRPGENNQVMLLSDRLWKSKFKADPRVAGRSVRLNDRIYTIVGVLPPGHAWLSTVDLFTPMAFRPNGERGSFDLNVIAKLSPGVSSAMAQADLNSVAARIAGANPRAKGIGMSMGSASDWAASAQTRHSMWMLLGAVALLLLIACVNLANLLLARGAGRVREMAVRSALGASRGRIAALALTESCLLCGAGSALGLLLASASVEALKASESMAIPRLAEVELNGYVLAFPSSSHSPLACSPDSRRLCKRRRSPSARPSLNRTGIRRAAAGRKLACAICWWRAKWRSLWCC